MAFECLENTVWADVPDGRFDISGDEVFAIVDRRTGKGTAAARLEIHRQYIDIQFLVSGSDTMGYRLMSDCTRALPFSSDKDVGFFDDRPDWWFDVNQNCFAVFYPWDAHAPMGTDGQFHKVVVKVRV
jgi:YhcH/YjgK/YiaL family protein